VKATALANKGVELAGETAKSAHDALKGMTEKRKKDINDTVDSIDR